jgi:hypothetical protein
VPTNLVSHKLADTFSEAVLMLLTPDVRLNRPNYPTVIDLASTPIKGSARRRRGTLDVGKRSGIPIATANLGWRGRAPATRWSFPAKR